MYRLIRGANKADLSKTFKYQLNPNSRRFFPKVDNENIGICYSSKLETLTIIENRLIIFITPCNGSTRNSKNHVKSSGIGTGNG